MTKLSKRKKAIQEAFPSEETHGLNDAVEQLDQFPKTNFDETVELHFLLNVNPKSSDQMVRGTVMLPHGTGKSVSVAVVCKGEAVQDAESAGADFVGGEDLIDKIANGFMDFDCVVAAPDMMRDLSKLGKILGPRGLMPSPKAGTVTTDIERVVKELKAGRVEFKVDKQSGVHVGVGKRSFTKEQIQQNIKHVLDALEHAKPASVKGNLIKTLSLSTTMGPGLRIAL
ncbi:MAG: 50S ribosomal protein L1 [Candidatus Omnitrophota bacterium]